MDLKLYTNMSAPPCRAIELFLRVTEIPHENHSIDLMKGEIFEEEYRKINPLSFIPFMDHDGFKLNTGGSILKYLVTKFKVADHWWPADPIKSARVDEAVAWQDAAMRGIRHYGILVVASKVLVPMMGLRKTDEKKAADDLEAFHRNASILENEFLKDTPFLRSNDVTIADLLTSSELMNVSALGCDGILAEHPALLAYLERVREKTNPHWDQIYVELKRSMQTLRETMMANRKEGKEAPSSAYWKYVERTYR